MPSGCITPPHVPRRTILAGGLATLATGGAWGSTSMSRPVVLGQVYLSFYAVTGAVVHEVLERLGHDVEVREGPHEQIFPLLGARAIDLMAAAWLPEGHASYWAQYGQDALEVTTLYDGARFFWGVPSYIPPSETESISDLAKPAIAGRMTKLIQGIGMGATISTYSERAVREYELDHLGYMFRPGTQADWIGAYDTAVRGQRWIVFPTWAPQYLNKGARIRRPDDPKVVLGGINRAVLVSPRDRWAELPEHSRAVLQHISLDLDGVTEMDWLVNVQQMKPREAAKFWMDANSDRVAAWLRA